MLNKCAKDIMTADVFWVNDDMAVSDVIRLFVEKKISGAPIVAASGEMVGVVSLRDILQYSANVLSHVEHSTKSAEYYVQGWDSPLSHEEVEWFHEKVDQTQAVREIMNPMVYSVDINTPVEELADIMLRGRVHRMMVIDNEELVGIVSSLDMLKIISELPVIMREYREQVTKEVEAAHAV